MEVIETNDSIKLEFHISILPKEIWIVIFDFLDGPDAARLEQVCRDWKDFIKQNKIWKKLVKEDEIALGKECQDVLTKIYPSSWKKEYIGRYFSQKSKCFNCHNRCMNYTNLRKILICFSCGSSLTIDKTGAKEMYCLSASDFERLLPISSGKKCLFLEEDVRNYALKKYNGLDGLEKRRETRDDAHVKRKLKLLEKEKLFQQDLIEQLVNTGVSKQLAINKVETYFSNSYNWKKKDRALEVITGEINTEKRRDEIRDLLKKEGFEMNSLNLPTVVLNYINIPTTPVNFDEVKEAIARLVESENQKKAIRTNFVRDLKKRGLECNLDCPPNYFGHAIRQHLNGRSDFPNSNFSSYEDFIDKITGCLKREQDLREGLLKMGLEPPLTFPPKVFNYIEGKAAFTLKRVISMTAVSCSRLQIKPEPIPEWKRILQILDDEISFRFSFNQISLSREEQLKIFGKMLDDGDFSKICSRLLQLYQISNKSEPRLKDQREEKSFSTKYKSKRGKKEIEEEDEEDEEQEFQEEEEEDEEEDSSNSSDSEYNEENDSRKRKRNSISSPRKNTKSNKLSSTKRRKI